MTCPRCGRPNSKTAGQCSACGTTLAKNGPTFAGKGPARTGPREAPATFVEIGGRPAPIAAGSDPAPAPSGVAAPASGGYGLLPGARLAPGSLVGARYEILGVLGEGGMGTVYKAQDRELGRLVALKVIRPDMASRPEILERFKREILLASQVTHKNVLRIHDCELGFLIYLNL